MANFHDSLAALQKSLTHSGQQSDRALLEGAARVTAARDEAVAEQVVRAVKSRVTARLEDLGSECRDAGIQTCGVSLTAWRRHADMLLSTRIALRPPEEIVGVSVENLDGVQAARMAGEAKGQAAVFKSAYTAIEDFKRLLPHRDTGPIVRYVAGSSLPKDVAVPLGRRPFQTQLAQALEVIRQNVRDFVEEQRALQDPVAALTEGLPAGQVHVISRNPQVAATEDAFFRGLKAGYDTALETVEEEILGPMQKVLAGGPERFTRAAHLGREFGIWYRNKIAFDGASQHYTVAARVSHAWDIVREAVAYRAALPELSAAWKEVLDSPIAADATEPFGPTPSDPIDFEAHVEDLVRIAHGSQTATVDLVMRTAWQSVSL